MGTGTEECSMRPEEATKTPEVTSQIECSRNKLQKRRGNSPSRST